MALSRVIRTGNGTTTQFVVDFALGYLDQADVTARVGDEVDGAGNPVYRTITFLSDTLMQISGPPAGNGVRVVFERTVEKEDTLVHFSNGDVMDEENLDLSFKQILMVVHEVLDGRFGQFDSDLDMGGFLVRNVGDPVDAGDLTTKRYVDARISTGQASATAAAASAAAAASSAASAASSTTAAAGSATTASNAAATATTSSENAYKWASEEEDVPVNDGTHTGYSAYHWCKKAELAAGGGVSSWAGLTGTIDMSQVMDVTRQFRAGTVAMSSMNIPHGVAPSSPVNGDMWTTTSGLLVRINGTVSTTWGSHNMAIVSQSEAELGTSGTYRAWSSLRVRQNAAAYAQPKPTVSTDDPSGGTDGDVWFKI